MVELDKAKVAHMIKSVSIFDSLNIRDKKKIEECTTIRTYQAGENLAVQGEPGNDFFYILSGTAKGMKRIPATDMFEARIIVTEFIEGDHFGETCLISHAARSSTVVATSECTVAVISKSDFESIAGPVKDALQRTNSIQFNMEKMIPRHRSLLAKNQSASVQSGHRTYMMVDLPELHSHSTSSTAPNTQRDGFETGPEILIYIHLRDKRGFYSCAKYLVNSQMKLNAILRRERALCLGKCDEKGFHTQTFDVATCICHFELLKSQENYCLLFDSRKATPSNPSSTSAAAMQNSREASASANRDNSASSNGDISTGEVFVSSNRDTSFQTPRIHSGTESPPTLPGRVDE